MKGKIQKLQRTYKFRLYPTEKQRKKLLWTLEKCRHVYNYLLQELKNQKTIDKAILQETVTDLKQVEPELKNVYSKVLKMEHGKLFQTLRQ